LKKRDENMEKTEKSEGFDITPDRLVKLMDTWRESGLTHLTIIRYHDNTEERENDGSK